MSVTATRAVDADAEVVFDLIADPNRLSTWNRIIQRTVDAPERVEQGAQWTVEMHALGQTWRSVSTTAEIDRQARHLEYRSRSDDGNPSYTHWSWTVAPAPSGCVVTVSGDLHPATFWRRLLLSKVRSRQLGRELPESLDRLAEAVTTPAGS